MMPASLHLGSTMTMAAGAKLFVNASFTNHQAISDERREATVGGGSRLWGRYNSPYLRGDRGDIGDHHGKRIRKESCYSIKFSSSCPI
jgi:hypothetical protein